MDGLGLRCRRCGDCCRTVRVPLTHRDLERLRAATGLAAESIGEWLAPDEIDMTGEPETFVRLRPGRRLLVLRHGDDGCRFLVDELCSVHAHRPLACAAFPFDLVEDGGAGAVRPLEGAPCALAEPPETTALGACLRALRAELAEYARRVDAWNRRQRHRQRLHRLPEPAERFFVHLSRENVERDPFIAVDASRSVDR
jgi:Fe-S-cluster containining protein